MIVSVFIKFHHIAKHSTGTCTSQKRYIANYGNKEMLFHERLAFSFFNGVLSKTAIATINDKKWLILGDESVDICLFH